MSARVPEPPNDPLALSEGHGSERIYAQVRLHEEEYKNAFTSYLMDYIKSDDILQNFYVRLLYECEIVRMVIKQRRDVDWMELSDLINDLKNATSIDELAHADAAFHRRLFSIAGEGEFYGWFQLQAKSLNNFLKGFWKYIGYKTAYYDQLMEIHTNIFRAIKEQDEKLALKSMQEHFAILLFELLSVTFVGEQEEEK